jgi:hypothetical protein
MSEEDFPGNTEGRKTRLGTLARRIFDRNPIAWMIFVLLLVSMYGNYETSRHLARACEDLQGIMRDPVSRVTLADWQKAALDEVDSICFDRVKTPEGS